MKNEVYSWRLSSDLKTDLEREARLRGMSISSVLDSAVRDWLRKNPPHAAEEEEQRRLHSAAAICIGSVASQKARRAETAREIVRERVSRRNAR